MRVIYLILLTYSVTLNTNLINRNMGCIEIAIRGCVSCLCTMINRNMGCIEMRNKETRMRRTIKINRNMGCIEI